MIDIIIRNSAWLPITSIHNNSLVLFADNWDDYGYHTLYHVVYFESIRESYEIGDIKIYNKYMDEKGVYSVSAYLNETSISRLNPNYCSLGQSLSYYSNLAAFLKGEYEDVLKRMQDMATNKGIIEEFIDFKGVRTSLLRESSAEKALREAYIYLRKKS